jgi:hypothetical protein
MSAPDRVPGIAPVVINPGVAEFDIRVVTSAWRNLGVELGDNSAPKDLRDAAWCAATDGDPVGHWCGQPVETCSLSPC